MKAKWTVNYELVAQLPPAKRWRYLFRRDAFFRYEIWCWLTFGVAMHLLNDYVRS